MKRNLTAFAAAFALAAALGAALTGCWSDDCNCGQIPPRPEVQLPLTGLNVSSYDSRGEIADTPVKPESGTLEVTGNTVVIRYQQAGAQHQVTYQVTGPR